MISSGEFVPSMLTEVMHVLLPEVCTESHGLSNEACKFFPQLVGGFSPNQVDEVGSHLHTLEIHYAVTYVSKGKKEILWKYF